MSRHFFAETGFDGNRILAWIYRLQVKGLEMNIPKNLLLFAALVSCFLLPSSAGAEFNFTPGFALSEEYNDNVFLTAKNRKSDFITTINPSFNIYYDRESLNLFLDYGFRYLLYANNSEDDKMYHNVNLQSTIRPFRDYVFIKVSDFFSRVPIDERRAVGYENNLANMTNSNVFSVNPYIEYPFSSTFRARAGYTYQNTWYEDRDGIDSQDHTAGIMLTKELAARLNTSLGYSYLFHRPYGEEYKYDEYDRQDVYLSVSYGVTEKLSLDGSAGWVAFRYGEHSGRNDFSAVNWSASARYLLTAAVALRAGYVRNYTDSYSRTGVTALSPQSATQSIIYPGEGYITIGDQTIPTSMVLLDSINGGLNRNDSINLGFAYSGKIPFAVTGFHNISKYMNIDRENRSTGVILSGSVPISSMLTAQFAGNYSYNKYLPENEKVNRYGARLALDYKLRIITLTLGYAFNKEDSNIDTADYVNNVVWLGAKLVF